MKTKKQRPQKEKKVIKTVADAFVEIMRNGVKNKQDASAKMLELLNVLDIKKTQRKTDITKDMCARQFSAINRDIKNQRQGWWSHWELVKDKYGIFIRRKK